MSKKIIKTVVSVMLGFVILINIPIIQVFHEESIQDHSNWMNETIDNNTNVIDIKMLGAHDAYSSDISITSDVDAYESGIASTVPGLFLKGLLVKQSKTQITDTEGLLKNGVRYLDVRLSYVDGEFYTKHGYVSTRFESVCEDIVQYLETYKGEVLILDVQHMDGLDYEVDEDYQIFYEALEDFGVTDYLYSSDNKALRDITYGDITSDKENSGVIILDKFAKITKPTYHYEQSIRSNWANDDDFIKTVSFLNEEADLVQEDSEYDTMFKVAQCVTTMQMDVQGMVNGLESWSLVERAQSFNIHLIQSDEFDNIIEQLPIIMVDYATSNKDDFVDKIMDIIIEKNKTS
jgi:hypothetical protein